MNRRPHEFVDAARPHRLDALVSGEISDYGDPRLPDSVWNDMYPCPVTGCWLTTATYHLDVDRWCGQSICSNPAHFRRAARADVGGARVAVAGRLAR